jgi:hypothetical protein
MFFPISGQFYQHFMNRNFSADKLLLWLLYEKAAQKTFVKLTPSLLTITSWFNVFVLPFASVLQYRWTSLYAIDRDWKICLEYYEFAYKKIKNDCKLGDTFQKYGQSQIREFADKKTPYSEVHLYFVTWVNVSTFHRAFATITKTTNFAVLF